MCCLAYISISIRTNAFSNLIIVPWLLICERTVFLCHQKMWQEVSMLVLLNFLLIFFSFFVGYIVGYKDKLFKK